MYELLVQHTLGKPKLHLQKPEFEFTHTAATMRRERETHHERCKITSVATSASSSYEHLCLPCVSLTLSLFATSCPPSLLPCSRRPSSPHERPRASLMAS
mmetsp:Transcript_48117/g.95980  ORF Transcript_48117/g.95980 Transcript_48117/m.95980 type:complete len:100 (-) Transcript_48117:971-1270(-)